MNRAVQTLEGLRAQLSAIRAQCDAALASLESFATGTSDVVTLDVATELLGSKRKARAFFARAERDGFNVSRVGHSVMMQRNEWERAVSAQTPKRRAPAVDDSPAALLATAGLQPARQRRR